jgi:hypothetical protein
MCYVSVLYFSICSELDIKPKLALDVYDDGNRGGSERDRHVYKYSISSSSPSSHLYHLTQYSTRRMAAHEL